MTNDNDKDKDKEDEVEVTALESSLTEIGDDMLAWDDLRALLRGKTNALRQLTRRAMLLQAFRCEDFRAR